MSRFFLLDVFAERPHTGNQLAVILGTDRSDEEMQTLAREMAFSETTFVGAQDALGRWPVRIFTPVVEVPFAGHPTLGTAAVICQKLAQNSPDTVVLSLAQGDVTVHFDGEGVGWMKPPVPAWGKVHPPETAAVVLGLSPTDIDPRFPVVDMSVGVNFTLVPLRTLDAVRRAVWHPEFAHAIRDPKERRGVFIFAPEPVEPSHHLHARMLASDYGVEEDSATGSANTCLAHYIRKYNVFCETMDIVQVEQGYGMLRPSLLRLKPALPVEIGGRALFTAQGELVDTSV